ncbi:MAG: PEP-CTERM sorting domain-containing protein [Phycisphaerae bacterium]|jgi:streptogramin lyase
MKRGVFVFIFAVIAAGIISANAATFDNLQWSVQYMIDTSQSDFGQIQSPSPRDNRGLAISPDGRYLYAGYNNGPAVRRIDLTVGDYIDAADIQLTGVRGKSIDVDDAGRVYFAEGTSIKIYNSDLSSNVFNLTGLTNSEGVTVTRQGSQLVVYNTDRGTGVLQKWLLTESGGSITDASLDASFGTGGSITIDKNASPRGLEVDSAGNIWVAGYEANKVYVVSADGSSYQTINGVAAPIDIDFAGGSALVTQYTQRQISVFDSVLLSLQDTITVPWASLELDPDGQSAGGALSGIVIFGNDLFVSNETGQTADEKSTYGRTDEQSGFIGDDFYTDLNSDDNDPILHTVIPEPTTIALLGLGIAGLLRKKR